MVRVNVIPRGIEKANFIVPTASFISRPEKAPHNRDQHVYQNDIFAPRDFYKGPIQHGSRMLHLAERNMHEGTQSYPGRQVW